MRGRLRPLVVPAGRGKLHIHKDLESLYGSFPHGRDRKLYDIA